MKIIVLNSGSNGNAVYVESSETGAGILLDCGISRRQIETRLKVHGRYLSSVRGVFITHEHADHVKGLQAVLRFYPIPVYLTEGTYRGIWQHSTLKGFHFMKPVAEYTVADFTVTAYPKAHDAADPVYFLVQNGGSRFLYITDLGTTDETLASLLPEADAIMIESNYDHEMLVNGSYPEWLKARVASDEGHLSNVETMNLIERHCNGAAKLVIFGHLSENNNSPELVRREYENILKRKPGFSPAMHIASRYDVSEVLSV